MLLKDLGQITRVEQCFNLPCIGEINRIDNKWIGVELTKMISSLNLYFPENQRLDMVQVGLVVDYINQNHFNLTLGDIKLIFDKIKQSKVFGSLSPNVIIQEIESYFSDRCEIASCLSKPATVNDCISPEIMKAWYDRVKQKGIPVSAEERIKKLKNDPEFEKFRAEYERNKIINEG
jgi:hypothetical protein